MLSVQDLSLQCFKVGFFRWVQTKRLLILLKKSNYAEFVLFRRSDDLLYWRLSSIIGPLCELMVVQYCGSSLCLGTETVCLVIIKLGKKFSQQPVEDIYYAETRNMLSNLGLQNYEKNFKKGLLTDRTLPLLTDRQVVEFSFFFTYASCGSAPVLSIFIQRSRVGST